MRHDGRTMRVAHRLYLSMKVEAATEEAAVAVARRVGRAIDLPLTVTACRPYWKTPELYDVLAWVPLRETGFAQVIAEVRSRLGAVSRVRVESGEPDQDHGGGSWSFEGVVDRQGQEVLISGLNWCWWMLQRSASAASAYVVGADVAAALDAADTSVQRRVAVEVATWAVQRSGADSPVVIEAADALLQWRSCPDPQALQALAEDYWVKSSEFDDEGEPETGTTGAEFWARSHAIKALVAAFAQQDPGWCAGEVIRYASVVAYDDTAAIRAAVAPLVGVVA